VLLSNGQTVALAPQALGETTPLTSTGYFYANAGLQLEQQYASYAQLYKVQPWVAVVVNKLAHAVARLRVQVWDESGDLGNTLDATSPYARLLAQPNSEMTPYSFWLWVQSTFDIYGECFLMKVRNDAGRVIQLLPMHPSRIAIERAPETGDLTYIFTAGVASQGLLRLPSADVVPITSYNPDSLMRGWSRLEPLRSTLMSEDSSRRATSAWWKNMGRPSMLLTSPGKMSADAKTRLKESFDSTHGGSGNAGGTVVLSDGLTASPMQYNADEMEYISTRKLNREEVCAVYDIPPPVVHILDNATYSNITEQMRSMYRDTMAPKLEFLESVMDTFLAGEVGFGGNRRARFAVSEVLRGDVEQRATTAISLVGNGIAKPAEVRPWFDLNDAGTVADRLYANSAMQPLGAPSSTAAPVSGDTAPPPQGSEPPVPPPAVPPSRVRTNTTRHFQRIKSLTDNGHTVDESEQALLASHPQDEHDIRAAASLAREKERQA
jgi:HK97 family phage portal protein